MLFLCFVIGKCKAAISEKPRCEFPDFLQTSDTKPWMLNHTATLVTYYINRGVISAYDCRKDTRECSSYKRVCWMTFSRNKFLVKHLESDFQNKYLCIQFLYRSRSIVQVKISHTKNGKSSKYLCNSHYLALDPWPWISEEHFAHAREDCPFSGGYNFELFYFDRYGDQTKCGDAIPPVRIESDCGPQEGVIFSFQSKSCLHRESNFDMVQRATCIASWRDQGDGFAVLRKSNDRYFWCMRVSFGPDGDVAKVIVFLDWVCDYSQNISRTKRHIEFHKLEKRNVTNVCTDEFYGCALMYEFCHTKWQYLCPRTCGDCSSRAETLPCSFPDSVVGHWQQSTISSQATFVVTRKTLLLPRYGEFRCITFSQQIMPLMRALLRTFVNGCYPRFVCIQFELAAPSVMRVRLSNMLTWPVALSDENICNKENFVANPDVRSSTYSPFMRPFQSLIKTNSEPHRVACNLPGRLPPVMSFEDRFGHRGCLIQDRLSFPRQLYVSYNSGAMADYQRTFNCIGALRRIGSYRSVITATQQVKGEFLCWIVVSLKYILQLPAASCNSLTAEYILSGRQEYRKLLLNSYNVTNATVECENYYAIKTSLTQNWKHLPYTGGSGVLFCCSQILVPVIIQLRFI